jgi:hypothetical protein
MNTVSHEKDLNIGGILNVSNLGPTQVSNETDSKAIGTTAVPYIIQNGKIYQLTSNNQLISRSSIELNHPILTTATSNVTSNENKPQPQQTIQQMPNQLTTAKLTIPISSNTQPQIIKNIPISLQNKIIMKPQVNNSNELNVQVINAALGQQYNQQPSQITHQGGNQSKIIISTGQTATNKNLIVMPSSNQTQQKINLPLTINKNMLGSNSKLHALINKNQTVSLNSVVANKSMNSDEVLQLKVVNSLPVSNTPNVAPVSINAIKNTNTITPVVNTSINSTKTSSNLPSPLLTMSNVQQSGKKAPNAPNVVNHTPHQITPVINKDNPSKSTAQTLNLVVDENFLSENAIGELNEFILPDTRIFASLLNKTGQQSTSNKAGNNKRNLDLTYKTAMIGQTEHVILDNQNNLSDYKGNLVQLQNLACLIANQLKKPVTIPAFMLIEQDNIDEIKSLFNEKNINPIVIETQMPSNSDNKVSNSHRSNQSAKPSVSSVGAHDNERNNQSSINHHSGNQPSALPAYMNTENSLIAKRLSEPIEDPNCKRMSSSYQTVINNTKENQFEQVVNSSSISANQVANSQNFETFKKPDIQQSTNLPQDFNDLHSAKLTNGDTASSLEQDDLNFDSFDANLFINFTEQLIS